ncbi:MAG: toxin HicA [Desulfobacteraceae bacterium IS3]|jgi:hypothetical protein|nr:MAG: toxin HicA [Desulfobacteraceae bacterium IS3]HAO21999.1 toxin HicA [Desulfobacteraceae bacterium]
MEKIEILLKKARQNPNDFRFSDLCNICDHFFGKARQESGSHRVYKTPWQGDPRVNIQKGKGGKAKSYQVRQVIRAVEKIRSQI